METKKSLTPIYELELSDGISLKIHVKKAKKGILSIILFSRTALTKKSSGHHCLELC